jgi:hypothetical protein
MVDVDRLSILTSSILVPSSPLIRILALSSTVYVIMEPSESIRPCADLERSFVRHWRSQSMRQSVHIEPIQWRIDSLDRFASPPGPPGAIRQRRNISISGCTVARQVTFCGYCLAPMNGRRRSAIYIGQQHRLWQRSRAGPSPQAGRIVHAFCARADQRPNQSQAPSCATRPRQADLERGAGLACSSSSRRFRPIARCSTLRRSSSSSTCTARKPRIQPSGS